ncbi:MAG: ferritin [Mycolicibacterium insubricum]
MSTDEPTFTDLLHTQVGNEFFASQQYTAVAVYFDGQDLPQLAQRFYQQSLEERNHAMMIVRYLLDKGVDVVIPGVPAVVTAFDSVRALVELALRQEREVTDQVTRLAKAARAEGDYLGEQFMGWFLKEQVEEVASMTTLLTIVDRADGNLFHLESFVARELNTRGSADPTAPTAAGGAI